MPAGPNQAPTSDGASIPYSYYATPFTFTFSDGNGAADIAALEMVIHASLTAAQSCYFLYEPASKLLYLADDTGTWMTGVQIGTASPVYNSRCIIDVKNVTVSTGVTSMTLSAPVTLRRGFETTKKVYGNGAGRQRRRFELDLVGAVTPWRRTPLRPPPRLFPPTAGAAASR